MRDNLERKRQEKERGNDMPENRKLKISFNSPVILSFTILCFAAMVLNIVTRGFTNQVFFSVYRSSLLSPLTYIRFFGHVLGHAGWSHLFGNITLILVVGPLLEEKYGSSSILLAIVTTALVTGLANFILFPQKQLLGASGVVFAFILLASFTSLREGEIPLTFILVALIYMGQQIYEGIFIHDNVSNLTHIFGGLIGSGFGYAMNKR